MMRKNIGLTALLLVLIHSMKSRFNSYRPDYFALACLLGSLAIATPLNAAPTPAEVADLRCEYRVNPLGVDAPKPRLSWKFNSDRRGEVQTAYQILVASTPELLAKDQGDLWDSKRVASEDSLHIEYAGPPLKTGERCFWKVRIWDVKGKASAWSKVAAWTMGVLASADWRAKWIQSPESDPNVAVWLRKTFDLEQLPSRALVNLAIAGYAELYINGKKAGRDVLTPSISSHYNRIFYTTYDVTGLLQPGRNVVGIWLGKGWSIKKQLPTVMARLEIESSGNSRVIGSDATWKTKASCYRYIGAWGYGCFGGERLDARDQVPDWCRANADETGWAAAIEGGGPKVKIDAQSAPLNRIGKEIPAVAVTPSEGNRYVIDFGTALTGWLRLKFPKLEPGAVVKMSFADAPESQAGKGKTNWQTFGQVSEFVSAGGAGEVSDVGRALHLGPSPALGKSAGLRLRPVRMARGVAAPGQATARTPVQRPRGSGQAGNWPVRNPPQRLKWSSYRSRSGSAHRSSPCAHRRPRSRPCESARCPRPRHSRRRNPASPAFPRCRR